MKRVVLKNMLILGASGVAAKSFDFLFRAYYSRVLGPEGMGLLSLGFSLHSVMLTFATAGLGMAVSKVASEYMEKGCAGAVKSIMHSALCGVATLSLLVMLATFIMSEEIAGRFLGDERVSLSICALAPSVLFMGISYCLKGCFYAARKTLPPATSEFLEQGVKFVSIKILLEILAPYGTEYACAAVFGGITIGELSSCAYLTLIYFKEERRNYGIAEGAITKPKNRDLVCALLGVSIPSMVTSLCCSFLRMKEEVLMVSALERGGVSHSGAVEMLGIIYGMAMPLLVLPLNLSGSVMSLLVPEISRAGVRSQERLRRAASKTYKVGGIMGVAVAILFMLLGGQITQAVYGDRSAVPLVVTLAPLCPIMFLDSLSSSMLSGLGKQLRLLGIVIADFALRFCIIYFALPKGQMTAFPLMIAASNLFTCALTVGSIISLLCPERKLRKKFAV